MYIVPFSIYHLWIVVSQILIDTASEIIACTVIVALLSTCHDVDVVNTKLMGIFCISFSFYIVFIGMIGTIPAKIVVFGDNRIFRNVIILFAIHIVGSYGCMQIQVFKAMNFIVYL